MTDDAFNHAYQAWMANPGNEQTAKAFEAECQRVGLERGCSATALRASLAEAARKTPGNRSLPKSRRRRKVGR